MEEFFLGENLVLAGNYSTKILLPGRILARIPEHNFLLGGILATTDFSAGFLPRYVAGIFPVRIPPGKRAISPASTGNLGVIPVPILVGLKSRFRYSTF